jgi:predicted enzyme related to lactoylglutathione lyase
MRPGAVDHVWFWVSDMDRAVAFYRDALGLSLRMRHEDAWAELEAGAVRIGLHGGGEAAAPRADEATARGGTVVFAVHDLDASKAALEERGVVFENHLGEVPGYARYASFADPDGNPMQLIEYVTLEGAGAEATAQREGRS